MKTSLDIYLPHSGKIERTIPTTSFAELTEKIQKAKEAQGRWKNLTLSERSQYLNKVVKVLHKEGQYFAEKIALYNGKLKEEALVAEIFPTLSSFRFFAGKVRNHLKREKIFLNALPVAKSFIEHEPLGVVGVISPWNYPFMLALQDVPAALMAGNAVIIKPSEYSCAIGHLIEELFHKAQLPENLVQCIYGYGDLGAQLIQSGVGHISFTGSTKTGKIVYEMAAKEMIPCTLELGGKDAAIVLEDANLQKAVEGITWASFTNCGQTCASVEMAFIPESKKNEFLPLLKSYFQSLPPTNFGRMNTLFQKELVEKQIDEAIQSGAQVLERKNLQSSSPNSSFCLDPIILINPPLQSKLLQEETFGPVLPILFYQDVNQVIEQVNSSAYGLTASLWTENYGRAEELAKRIESGVVTINNHMITPGFPEAPWLGRKMSGLGYSHSYLSLKKFSKLKYVFHDRGLISFRFWQYPFSPAKTNWLLKFQESQFATSLVKRLFYQLLTLPKLLFGSSSR